MPSIKQGMCQDANGVENHSQLDKVRPVRRHGAESLGHPTILLRFAPCLALLRPVTSNLSLYPRF